MIVQPAIPYEIGEVVRFFGSIVGTEGVGEDVKKECNKNLLKLIKSVSTNVDNLIAENSKSNIGLV